MRMINYINEMATTLLTDDIKVHLLRDCMPYLKEVHSLINHKPHYLYRGIQGNTSPFVKKTVRSDRNPTDSSPEWQNALDNEFHKKFGVRPRSSGLFCSFTVPSGYGYTYIVFPIRTYKMIYSKEVHDLYFEEPLGFDLGQIFIKSEQIVDRYKITNRFVDVVNTIGDGKNEIMVLCKEYYIIDFMYQNELDYWVKNGL